MIPVLIVAGIIFAISILLTLLANFKVRKKLCYTFQTHKIEIFTGNYVVKLLVPVGM